MSLLSSSPSSLTTPPPPLTKRPDFPRNSPVPREFSQTTRTENGPLFHAMTASLHAAPPNSSSVHPNARSSATKLSFSLSNYPGPPPTVRASPSEGPLRFGGAAGATNAIISGNNGDISAMRSGDSTESVWRMCGGQLQQQQQQQQPQQHHMDLSVKIRRKTIDGAVVSRSGVAKTGVAVANCVTPLDFGDAGAKLAPLPSASALNASLHAATAPLLSTESRDVVEAASSPISAAPKKKTSKKPKAAASVPTPSAKDALAAYEDTIVKAFAETLYRCTRCSASTPAMFKTTRSFSMHFCSAHNGEIPFLKPLADALRSQGAAKRSSAEADNDDNNDDAASSEPAAKRRKREPCPPAGLLAIAEGLKRSADAGWSHSTLLNAARMENNFLVKESSSKPTPSTLATAPGFTPNQPQNFEVPTSADIPSEPNSQLHQQLSGMDRPLKVELDDSCSKSNSPAPPPPPAPLHLPRIESTNRRKKGMMVPTKVTAVSPSDQGENNNNVDHSGGSVLTDEDSNDMPPSPQPLTIISEDNNKKSPKTVLMEEFLQKSTAATSTTNNSLQGETINNNNDENCNDKNVISNTINSINTNNTNKGAKSTAKAYANALNALTGPGLSRSQLINAFSSPDAIRNLLPPAGGTAIDGSFIKVEQSDDGNPLLPPIPSDSSSSTLMLRDTLAGMPLVPGMTPSFTNDPFMDAFKTLLMLPSLSAEERLKIEKPYECDQCGRRFTRSDKVSRHKLIHSGEKPFECEICLKRFHRSDKLTVHKKIHTGERPHACDVCGKRFTRHYHLTKHRSLHTGNRPHACNVCPKKFFDRYSQLRHMKTHPENAALFAACNTPQEVIEALNAVTGFPGSGGGADGRLEGRPDAALFSPNNNPSWTKELEMLFRAAKSDSPAKGSDVSGSQKDVDEDEEEDELYDEDDTDDEMEGSVDGSSVGRKTPSSVRKFPAQDPLTPASSAHDASSLLLGLSANNPSYLSSRDFVPIKKELPENNNSSTEDHNLLNFAAATAVDSRPSNTRQSL